MRRSRKSVKKPFLSIWALILTAVLLAAPVYAAEAGCKVQLPVACTGGDETFQFDLAYEEAQGQTVENGTLFLKSGESGYFVIAYDSPGTYYYTVSQKAGSDSRTTYDKTVYQVEVWVTVNDDGILSAAPVIYAEGSQDKKAELKFVNSKQPAGGKDPDSEPGSGSEPGPDDEAGTVKTGAVKTGDTAQIGLWIAVMLAAAGALSAAFWKKRRKGEGD